MLRDIVSFLCEFRKKFLDKGFMAVRDMIIGLITDNVRNIYYGRITKRQKRQK